MQNKNIFLKIVTSDLLLLMGQFMLHLVAAHPRTLAFNAAHPLQTLFCITFFRRAAGYLKKHDS